ncbi:MAG: type III-A CRISPR-associated RAMP protein Csm3 [Lewinellaceae bacterium]|nr:type III-A CRISPR-associated RAMP protein Csm3 [Lewinellaceae bacterium]
MEDKTLKGQLVKKIFIKGTITAVSGLHIGGSNLGLSIGGVDNAIVRNPLDNFPYVPGSSLKGKMRSLLERLENKIGTKQMGDVKYGPYQNLSDPETNIPKVFGIASDDEKVDEPVSRLIVRDCHLTKDSRERLEKMVGADMPYSEVKTEVVIDRITSRAMPRQIERVPAGTIFDMELVLNIYYGDDESAMLKDVLQALSLVQDDYLGGSGTRGSGQVKIKVQPPEIKELKDYEAGTPARLMEGIDIPIEIRANGN